MRKPIRKAALPALAFVTMLALFITPALGQDQGGEASFEATYHYSLGTKLALDGNLPEAAREYEQALSLDPKSAFLATELAGLYVKMGEMDRALAVCEQNLIHHPDHVETYGLMGSIYLFKKDYEKAARSYRRVIDLDPKSYDTYLYLSVIYAEMKRYEEATGILQDLLKQDPKSVMGHYYLGKLYGEMKLYKDAISWMEKAVALKPGFESALSDLALLYEIQNESAKARALYGKLIEEHPQRLSYRLRLAKLDIREKHYDEAIRILEDVLKLDSRNREARLTLALAYLEVQKPERAVEELNVLLQGAPNDHEARYFLAGAYEERKMNDEALREYERIPSTSSLYAGAQVRAGYILKSQGKTAEAIERAKKAITVKANDAALYGLLAALYESDNRLAEAEKTLKDGLAVAPKSIDLRYRLGMIYDKTGRSDEAIVEMEEILKQEPDSPEALNFIGYSWADRGIRLDEAEAMIKKALALKPGDGFITDSLGWVYYRKNKLSDAIKYLKEAAAILPEDAAIADHLGDAYEKAGKHRDALEQYRKALKLKPDMKGLQEKIDRLEARTGGKR